ncbi:hypothetical protein ERHA54_49270 (plasmid) [Erwinia rhapontici]|uniref:Uncharacterized protein n=1 Tax=Erwinia rhapontici TaxID=55212 RepID=A0ABM7N755_ERWRD|nr:hypothetical protein ERHA53_46500 [Erwinia rhapontici]BCQ42324.1 hypothetical protein ERHA54_49270 [Erwinia rhapontici]
MPEHAVGRLYPKHSYTAIGAKMRDYVFLVMQAMCQVRRGRNNRMVSGVCRADYPVEKFTANDPCPIAKHRVPTVCASITLRVT